MLRNIFDYDFENVICFPAEMTLYLLVDQKINFVVNNRVKAFLFQEFDGVFAVIVIAPAEEDLSIDE